MITLMQFLKTAYLAFILVGITTQVSAQDDSVIKEKNGVVYTDLDIESNDDYASFDILLPEIDQYNIFFTGENHLFRNSNYKLQLKMLKYLHQKRGVKHLLLEFGFSRGYYVDQYVNTGDTTIIDMLTNYSYPEYVKLYKGIHEYNKTLDSADRIHVHGIDLERSSLTSVKLLSLLISEKETTPHDSIALDVEAIKSLMGYNDSKHNKGRVSNGGIRPVYDIGVYSSEQTLIEILKGYERNKSHYQDYLGDDFGMFDKVMSGLDAEAERQRLEKNRTLHAKIYRETYMFNQFVGLVDEFEGERFFSQFGRCHTATQEQDEWCNFYHFKTLASRITSSDHPGLKDKVCSIAAYYPRREVSYLEGEAYNQINKLVKDLGVKDDEMILMEVNDDSAYFGDLVNKFQFLIINNHTLQSDLSDATTDDKDDSYYYNYPVYVNLTGDYSMHWLNLDPLNEQLTNLGFADFSGNMVSYGGALTVFENLYSAVKFSFSYAPGEEQTLATGESLKLDGWFANFRQGFDVTDNKHFNVIPYWGFGMSTLRMDYTQSQTGVVITDGLFSSVQDQTLNYKNRGALFDLGMDLRANFSIVTLGVSGGYFLDMSNRQWRLNGRISEPSPKTSFSSPYINFFVGFSFHD